MPLVSGMARSRLDTRESEWWSAFELLAEKHNLSEQARDEFFDVVLNAIDEDGAVTAASRGGLKGGKARAERMTPRQRSISAHRAAEARWARVRDRDRRR